jgi:hypothetical protein
MNWAQHQLQPLPGLEFWLVAHIGFTLKVKEGKHYLSPMPPSQLIC